MSKNSNIIKIVFLLMVIGIPLFGGGIKLEYKLKSGEEWVCTLLSKNETAVMGQKTLNSNKSIFIYKVSKGSKRGWVSLTAHIQPSAKDKESGVDMSRMRFKADMHRSGEFRHITYSGNPMAMQGNMKMPPEMKAMMVQQGKMMGEMYKNALFWFPELPEERLQVGDDFEVERVMKTGGNAMQTKTLIKQVFTLEEVSKGLAYFSVKQRSITKTKSSMAGKTETKSAGKGEAIFDVNAGMWLELTEKSRVKISMGSIPGMGDISSDMKITSKYEIEMK